MAFNGKADYLSALRLKTVAVNVKHAEPFLDFSSCLDPVHGDDDRILPLLLHYTGKARR